MRHAAAPAPGDLLSLLTGGSFAALRMATRGAARRRSRAALLLLLSCLVLVSRAAAPLPLPPPARAADVAGGKTIWLLWLDSWASAPWLAKQVAASWEAHNNGTGWRVVRLTRANLAHYAPDAAAYLDAMARTEERTGRGWRKPQRSWLGAAQSDVVRVNVLARHGGVWADATLLCAAPLDAWVYAALAPSHAFFAYRTNSAVGGDGPGADLPHGRPCSWFLVATRQSALMRAWRAAVNEYWAGRINGTRRSYGYFWLDVLLATAVLPRDPAAAAEWAAVPTLECSAAGGPHLLAMGYQSAGAMAAETRSALTGATPPFVVKLSRHELPNDDDADAAGDEEPALKSAGRWVDAARSAAAKAVALARPRRAAAAPRLPLRETAAYAAVALLMPPPRGDARDAWAKAAGLAAAAFGNATAHNSTIHVSCGLPGNATTAAADSTNTTPAHDALLVADSCGFCAALPANARCVPVAPLPAR